MIIIISDLHLREESADLVLGKILPEVGRMAAEIQAGVAILGDVYHFRYRVPVYLLNGLREELLSWKFVHTHVLPGNHDQIDVAGRNALEHLDDIAHVRVFTKPEWTGAGDWLPYRKNPADIMEALAMFSRVPVGKAGYPPRPKVLFMHHGVRGAMMNNLMTDTEGLPISLFESYERVICGHYHKHHTIGNVTYVGSPYQTKADEAGQVKGYCTWDGENLTHHPMDWGKRYHRIHLKKGDKLDTNTIRPGDEVRITTAPDVNPKQIAKKLQNLDVEHVVTPEVQVMEQRLEVGSGASLQDYAQAYVATVETPLDKDRLMAVFQEVTAP